MRVLELYSGIGGMHYALQESGINADVIAAVDINTVANDVYKKNFPKVQLMNQNIQSLSLKKIQTLNIDTILMSPPCQPFTRIGLKKDTSDARSCSFLYVLEELIPKLEALKYILIENVKGFETSETREKLLSCLRNSGFAYKELILSPCQFGIPNSRHRYYLLAKKKDLVFCFDNSDLEYNLTQNLLKLLPINKHYLLAKENDETCFKLQHILQATDDQDVEFLIPPKLLEKRAWILDIRTSESTGTCCFTKAYGRYIEGTGSVYCPFSKNHLERKFNELKEYEKYSKEQLEIFVDLKMRYFTPKEISRLMCFPESFQFPENTTIKQQYRLLGNSINVYVVGQLIFLLNSKEKSHV